jgi:Mg-chelatase subunit ChlD
VPSFTPPNP